MKSNKLSNVFAASIMALGLAVTPLALPASAQTETAPNNNTNTETFGENNRPNLDTTPFQETEGQHDNFGWLGLIGLLGLLNLFRKPKQRAAYRDPDARTEVGQPGSRL